MKKIEFQAVESSQQNSSLVCIEQPQPDLEKFGVQFQKVEVEEGRIRWRVYFPLGTLIRVKKTGIGRFVREYILPLGVHIFENRFCSQNDEDIYIISTLTPDLTTVKTVLLK